MAPSDNQSTSNDRATKGSGDADLAQAYRDLARGEQAATALESNLSNLESRLDAILAALEAKEDPQSSATATAAKAEASSKATGAAGHEDEVQDGYGSHDATKDKDTA